MIRKFIIAAAALAATTLPTAASAVPFMNFTPNVGGTFGNNDPTTFPPLFNDVFSFTTGFARSATVEITSSFPITNGRPDFTQNVNFVVNGVRLNAQLIPATSTGQFERRFLANFRIPAGLSTITVRGSSSVNGVYSGLLTLSGVPEPTTWALMIAGFGMTGAAMRRRARKSVLAAA
ncbi:MAG: FxDxF family PEP-CTERM protein [Sphingomonas sp.]